MSTPYDGQILLVNWLGRQTPGATIADTARLLRQKMPNVAGLMLKTSNGVSWQGHLSDEGPKAVTGVRRIAEWVEAFGEQGLDIHVWGVPRARRPAGVRRSPDLAREAEKLVAAATVPGVKSLLLDVEHGPFYWEGEPIEVIELMTQVRSGVGPDCHIGMILDPRRNRPFSFWVDPWISFMNSLHPMVYPILFGSHLSIEQHIEEAFRNLGAYDMPLAPMLQAFGEFERRPTPEEIKQQGVAAWSRGAAGISFFRLGSDVWVRDGRPQMGEEEYAAIARIPRPQKGDGPADIPTYTWQDVINATVSAALEAGAAWDSWFSQAGLWTIFDNALRPHPYSGPPILHWPIPEANRRRILELLNIDSASLAKLTAERQRQQERERREAAIRRRQRRGAIIGIHGAPGVAAPRPDTWDKWLHFLREMGVKWYKQCDFGDPQDLGPHSTFAWAKRLKQEGIEPIIRYLVMEQFPDALPDHYFQKMEKYAAEQILWAEIGNEPNLDIEWKTHWRNHGSHTPMRHTNPEAIRIIAETWVKDSQKALAAGVRPAFYAFAPTDWRGGSHPLYSSVFFTQKVVAYLAQQRRAETLDIFRRGGWIAVHAATYAQPDDFDPFRPDGTIWDMTLRGYEVVLRAFGDQFGDDLELDKIPVISTEGGVFTPDSTSMNGHERLATNEEHARRAVQMFHWLEQNSPLQAMCPWCISVGSAIGHFNSHFQFDGWIEELNGQLVPRAVYEAMRQLRFDHEREIEENDPQRTTLKLAVPYISQFDETAASRISDCGPTCLAMILNAERPAAQQVTVDQLYDRHLPHKGAHDFTTIAEMLQVGRAEGLGMSRRDLANGPAALQELRRLIEANNPFIVLVNYSKWDDIARNHFRGGHYVVVTGFDEEHVFVHDPLFRGSRRHLGEFFVWRNQRFLDGWGSNHEIDNPNFVAIIPDKQVARL